MEKEHKHCQSCRLPFKNSLEHRAMNSDGTLNYTYCKYCMDEGEFRNPEWTIKDMKKHIKHQMVSSGVPKILANFMFYGLKGLERWKKK